MGDALAKKVPSTIIYTVEFDKLANCARQARNLFKKNGTLLDYGNQPGTLHGDFNEYELKGTN
jgi:hypothetical protein